MMEQMFELRYDIGNTFRRNICNRHFCFFCKIPTLSCDGTLHTIFLDKYTGDMLTEEQNELIESAAEMLYGLIHVRYILTSKGLAAMVTPSLPCTYMHAHAPIE
jgi:hypothetical protein